MNKGEAQQYIADVVKEMTFEIEVIRPDKSVDVAKATLGQWVLVMYAAMTPEQQAKVRDLISRLRPELPADRARDN